MHDLIKTAYLNRYGFDRVLIASDGRVFGHWVGEHEPVYLGRVADHRIEVGTFQHLMHNDERIYSFERPLL